MNTIHDSTALVRTAQSPALARVSNQLALTDKLLISPFVGKLIVYDYQSNKTRNKLMTIALQFVIMNFWHFIPCLIQAVKDGKCSDIESNLDGYLCEIENVEDRKFNYEYPNVPYRRRGGGNFTTLIGNNDLYIPKKLDPNTHGLIMRIVGKEIASRALVTFAHTSVGKIIGLQVRMRM